MAGITINTKVLQKMVTKVTKCATEEVSKPISRYFGIKVVDNVFYLSASDGINIIKVFEVGIVCEDFSVTIYANKFNKLVQKTTCTDITLTSKGTYLEFKGNGVYKIELPVDPNEDTLIDFDNTFSFVKDYYNFGSLNVETSYLKTSVIKNVVAANKVGLFSGSEFKVPAGNTENYYCSENVVTSTGIIIALTNTKLFDKEFLAPKSLLRLLIDVEDEHVDITRFENKILFKALNVEIYSVESEDDRMFNYEQAVSFLTELKFEGNCEVLTSEIKNVVERIGLFTTTESEPLELMFTPEGLVVESKNSLGRETVPYTGDKRIINFNCVISLKILREVINAHKDVYINILYGHEVVIKFETGITTYLVALAAKSVVPEIENEGESTSENLNYSDSDFNDGLGEDVIPF